MCGIAGGIWIDPRNSLSRTTRRMTAALKHRGPDDSGTHYVDWSHDGMGRILPGVALGFRRLSIIDLKTGHQPLSNEDGTIQIIFNARSTTIVNSDDA